MKYFALVLLFNLVAGTLAGEIAGYFQDPGVVLKIKDSV